MHSRKKMGYAGKNKKILDSISTLIEDLFTRIGIDKTLYNYAIYKVLDVDDKASEMKTYEVDATHIIEQVAISIRNIYMLGTDIQQHDTPTLDYYWDK